MELLLDLHGRGQLDPRTHRQTDGRTHRHGGQTDGATTTAKLAITTGRWLAGRKHVISTPSLTNQLVPRDRAVATCTEYGTSSRDCVSR